jgi:hypothetical protein
MVGPAHFYYPADAAGLYKRLHVIVFLSSVVVVTPVDSSALCEIEMIDTKA